MVIKRFHFCPIWRIDRTEQWLKHMEAEGYRLEKVTFFRMLYYFKPSKPRFAQYIFLYTSSKGKDMSTVAYGLRQEYSANEIISKTSFFSLYRVTKHCDLTFERETRYIYFRSLLLALFLMTLFIGSYISLMLYAFKWFAVMIGCATVFFALIAYYLYGFIYTAIHVYQINIKHRKR